MYGDDGFAAPPGMIRVDASAGQLGRHAAALALEGDAVTAARWLAGRLATRRGDGRARAEVARQAARAELGRLNPRMPAQLEMVEAIREGLPGAVIVGDSTQPVYAGNLFYDHDLPGGWFNAATGFGALGYGPGAAVGAAIGRPGSRIVCLVGDGGLQFSPGELRTAVDERADVTFVVWNNAGFREIEEAMREAGAEPLGCAPSPLKLEPFAAACDLPFTSVPMEPDALVGALRAGAGPRLIEVRVAD